MMSLFNSGLSLCNIPNCNSLGICIYIYIYVNMASMRNYDTTYG